MASQETHLSDSICSHLHLQLAQLIVNAGGVAAVVDYLGETRGNVRLPGVMMVGYVAAHSENLAMAVIVSKVREGGREGGNVVCIDV